MDCENDCENYKAKDGSVDPVSGLTPRFKPNTPLPEGAILIAFSYFLPDDEPADVYWLPYGSPAGIRPNGKLPPLGTIWGPETKAAARALNLPLDLAEGEEAWTDERLEQSYRLLPNRAVDEAPEVWQGYLPHCLVASHIGLDNLRRWKHGWICRRIPAQAKPASYTVNAVDAPCRRWGQCVSLAKFEAQPCCGCGDHEPDEPALASVEARLEKAGATTVLRLPTNGSIVSCYNAFVRTDGKVDLSLLTLILEEAEAALEAAQGRNVKAEIDGMTTYAGKLRQQLTAKDAALDERNATIRTQAEEIERLARILEHSGLACDTCATVKKLERSIEQFKTRCDGQHAEILRQRGEIERLRGEIAEQLTELGKRESDRDAAWVEVGRLKNRIRDIDGRMLVAISTHGLSTPQEGYDKAGWNWLEHDIYLLARNKAE